VRPTALPLARASGDEEYGRSGRSSGTGDSWPLDTTSVDYAIDRGPRRSPQSAHEIHHVSAVSTSNSRLEGQWAFAGLISIFGQPVSIRISRVSVAELALTNWRGFLTTRNLSSSAYKVQSRVQLHLPGCFSGFSGNRTKGRDSTDSIGNPRDVLQTPGEMRSGENVEKSK